MISAERSGYIAIGKAMRDARVARQETLLEASRKMGIGPAELSSLEHGRAPALAYDGLAVEAPKI